MHSVCACVRACALFCCVVMGLQWLGPTCQLSVSHPASTGFSVNMFLPVRTHTRAHTVHRIYTADHCHTECSLSSAGHT